MSPNSIPAAKEKFLSVKRTRFSPMRSMLIVWFGKPVAESSIGDPSEIKSDPVYVPSALGVKSSALIVAKTPTKSSKVSNVLFIIYCYR